MHPRIVLEGSVLINLALGFGFLLVGLAASLWVTWRGIRAACQREPMDRLYDEEGE